MAKDAAEWSTDEAYDEELIDAAGEAQAAILAANRDDSDGFAESLDEQADEESH